MLCSSPVASQWHVGERVASWDSPKSLDSSKTWGAWTGMSSGSGGRQGDNDDDDDLRAAAVAGQRSGRRRPARRAAMAAAAVTAATTEASDGDADEGQHPSGSGSGSGSGSSSGGAAAAEEDGSDYGEDEAPPSARRLGSMGSGTSLTKKEIEGNFHLGLKEAALRLGVCATTLKRRCRKLGIERWPHRTIKKYEKALQQVRKMEAASGIQRNASFGARTTSQDLTQQLSEVSEAASPPSAATGSQRRVPNSALGGAPSLAEPVLQPHPFLQARGRGVPASPAGSESTTHPEATIAAPVLPPALAYQRMYGPQLQQWQAAPPQQQRQVPQWQPPPLAQAPADALTGFPLGPQDPFDQAQPGGTAELVEVETPAWQQPPLQEHPGWPALPGWQQNASASPHLPPRQALRPSAQQHAQLHAHRQRQQLEQQVREHQRRQQRQQQQQQQQQQPQESAIYQLAHMQSFLGAPSAHEQPLQAAHLQNVWQTALPATQEPFAQDPPHPQFQPFGVVGSASRDLDLDLAPSATRHGTPEQPPSRQLPTATYDAAAAYLLQGGLQSGTPGPVVQHSHSASPLSDTSFSQATHYPSAPVGFGGGGGVAPAAGLSSTSLDLSAGSRPLHMAEPYLHQGFQQQTPLLSQQVEDMLRREQQAAAQPPPLQRGGAPQNSEGGQHQDPDDGGAPARRS